MARFEPYVKASEVVRRVPNLLDINGESNIGLVMVSAVGPRLAYIQGPAQFLATYTIGGEIPRNADISFVNAYYLSFSAGLVIARAMNTTATGGLLFSDLKDSKDEPLPPEKVIYKDGTLLTRQTDITITPNESTWSFVLNDTVFFNGNYSDISVDEDYRAFQTKIQVDELSDVADSVNNWKECAATFESDMLKIKHGIYVDFETSQTGANKGIDVEFPSGYFTLDSENKVERHPVDIIQTPLNNWLFSVYSEAAQTQDTFGAKIKLISGEDKNFEFTVMYPGVDGKDVNETYLASLYPEGMDKVNGISSYIDNLNVMPNFKFKVNIFKNDVLPLETPNVSTGQLRYFGKSGLDLETSKKSSNLKLAVTELEEQVKYDIEYLAPVGITNAAFLKRFIQAGRANYWFTPIDVPKDRTNANSIQQYMYNIDDDSNVYCCGPFDKNSGLTGWINYIACSTLYYEKLMRNKAQGAEFAPIFDREYGTFQMTNPAFQLGKTDRENLLSFGMPVNFIKYDQRLDLFYMNNNLTHQSVDDVMSEEHNRRIVNKIKKDLVRLMQQFKGKFNSVSTRGRVVDLITFYFQNNIMNKQFPPDAYNIICDESNNPPEIIRANKLGVTVQARLFNSIKYIDILVDVFPIGLDFSQSQA